MLEAFMPFAVYFIKYKPMGALKNFEGPDYAHSYFS